MNGQIELTIGDLVVAEADVIVNAANTDMIMGGGVARDILNEAGPEIEEEPMQQRSLETAGADRPGCLWAGTLPGGLFRSEDRGGLHAAGAPRRSNHPGPAPAGPVP